MLSKKEIIWRHILTEALTRKITTFTQKDIASYFHFSTSTVFSALNIPRKSGIVEVTGSFFKLRDSEKLLYLWATHRNFSKDIIYKTYVEARNPMEIEGRMSPDIIYGAFSAFRFANNEAPADYSEVYVYTDNLEEMIKRFPPTAEKGIRKDRRKANLFVLQPDPFLKSFGKITPDPQTFVDLWNISEWYAKDFLQPLKRKMNLI